MEAERPTLRARAFRTGSRVLHRIGLVALARPLLNRARLRVDGRGRARFPFVQWRRARNGQILIYHRVNDDRDPYFGGVPTRDFDRQMGYLAARFRVLPLSDLIAGLAARTLPDNAVAVTFDDGYRDNYVHAFPILRRHSIPATIFLATAAIGATRQLWHDDVFSAFRETAVPVLEPFGLDQARRPLGTVPERLTAQREFLAYIRTLREADRATAVSRLRAALRVGEPRDATGLMLSWDEARAMSRAGISFGSHTATHPILSRVDPAQARQELVESKRVIEDRLGVAVDGFAYPNGTRADFLPETKALLRESGYAYAVTTIPGPNEPETDPMELRRATPWDEDVFAFGARLHYNKLRA
jgi:peptidoglycan/xylan/chitin deacetylase (PgdA/CDA1 family)